MGVIPTVPILPGTAVNRLYVILKCRWVTVDNRPAPGVGDRLNHDTHTVSQTETWLLLSLVNGDRSQSLHRSRSRIPAMRAIKSSSDGHM